MFIDINYEVHMVLSFNLLQVNQSAAFPLCRLNCECPLFWLISSQIPKHKRQLNQNTQCNQLNKVLPIHFEYNCICSWPVARLSEIWL